jgi:hypothetical protein
VAAGDGMAEVGGGAGRPAALLLFPRARCSSFLALGSARRCERGTNGSTMSVGPGHGSRGDQGGAHSGLGDQAATMAMRKVGRGGVRPWGEEQARERGSGECQWTQLR